MNSSVIDNKNEASQHQLERLLFQSLILLNCEQALSSENNDEEEENNELDVTDDLSSPDAQLAVYLAASFFEYSDSLFAGSNAWNDLSDWHEPTLTWLRESDEDAAARIEDHPQALGALTEGLFALFSLPAISSRNARFAVGDRVLAVLKQDFEWHEAIVENIQEDSNDVIVYRVRFIEYGAPQMVSDEDIAFDPNLEEELDSENACRVCRRVMPLTFHHLIPRETHSHVLKKGGALLIPVIESLYSNRGDKYKSKSRKDWLEVHGVNICRKCHSQIHRVESNMSLALKFNTLESIMQHPHIIKWRAWASRQ